MAKNKGGRPKKLLEDIAFDGWDLLDSYIIFGSEVYCADKLKMNVDTLADRIKDKTGLSFSEYKYKKQEPFRMSLMKKQYEVAMTGNVTMLIWLGKQYLGQSDKVEEVNGKPSEIKVNITKYEPPRD